jgi:hypothetical protein
MVALHIQVMAVSTASFADWYPALRRNPQIPPQRRQAVQLELVEGVHFAPV